MSSKPPIAYIDIRVFAHATEDTDKVETAVQKPAANGTGRNPYFPKNKLNGALMETPSFFLQPN